MTTAAHVLTELDSLSSEQVRRIYERRQPGAQILGVKFGDMGKIVKRIKRNSDVARKLWESGSFEARHIACNVMDPADLSEHEIDQWAGELSFPLLADDLAGLVYKTPYAEKKRRAWTARPEEFIRRAGYSLVHLAASDQHNPITDEELLGYLDLVQREIHQSANWAREMMNFIPVAVGRRSEVLFDPAVACARAYGTIDVFHGDNTNCKITDALRELIDPPKRPVRGRAAT